MMWDLLKDTGRFKFVPESKVLHVPIGKPLIEQ